MSEFSGSSSVEQRIENGNGGSQPSQRANTWLYILVRNELSGGALLAHVAHAAREALGPAPTEDERAVVLTCSKEQMRKACEEMDAQGIPYKACIEVDGPLAGTIPSVGVAVADKETVRPIFKELRPWRAK
jgi:hypothetical protein